MIKSGIPIIFACLLILIVSCAGRNRQAFEGPANYLPTELAGSELKRSPEIRTFSADSLWVYIDGGAEEFLKYNFIEVSTADYKTGAVEIVADIYSFKSASDAKSMFVTVKPENVDNKHVGEDGFVLPGDYEFIRGRFYIKLVGFDESSETIKSLEILAKAIDRTIINKLKAK